MTIITVSEVASQLGCDPATIRRICKRESIGTLLTPRQRILVPSDVAKIKKHFRGSVGNPNWTRKEP